MFQKLPRCLIPAPRIAEKVRQLGQRIGDDYADTGVDLLVVLKGAALFGTDLARAIDPVVDVRLHFIRASSYGDGTQSSGAVEVSPIPDGVGAERPILIVEDIVDTGHTADVLLRAAANRNCCPERPRLATLLDKPSRRSQLHPIVPDYVGFTVDDLFVVGYGLDDQQRLRHLGWIGVVDVGAR